LLPAYTREIRPTLALALPIIVGQVSQMLMGVTDSVMVGHAGTVPLAASAFGGNVFSIFYVLGIGAMVPVAIFVSRAHGAHRLDDAAEYLRHGVFLALACGALESAVLGGLSLELGHFGQPPEVLAIVRPFFLLIGGSITPVLLYLVLRQFAEAMGRPWVPMYIMLGGIGLNAFLNWVLIFGHCGAPAMGLTGSGLSTLLSRTLGTIVIFIWLRVDPATRAAWPERWWKPLSRARCSEMIHVAVPAAGMLAFEACAFAISAVMVGWLGAVPLAAHQIALTCGSLAFMFPLGLSMAAGMRISRAVGAGERHRLRPIGFSTMVIAMGFTGSFALAFGLAGQSIAAWFVHDPAVIALATQLLVVAAFFQLFDGWQANGAALLRGITDVRIPALITFIAYGVIALPLGYALGIRGPWGAIGVWIGIASGLAFAAIFLAARFTRLTRQ
jgi:MATE family multidrug resistance protein